MVADVEEPTVPTVMGNVPKLEPCAIVTVDGTSAAIFELASETDVPPAPAGAVRLTVPEAGWPLETVAGLTAMPLSAGGGALTVTLAVALRPEYEAVITTELGELTIPPVNANVAEVAF